MKKFKSAVIGAGFIGIAHVEALRRLGNVEVVAICNRHNAEEIAQKLSVEKAYTDYRKLIDEEELDFVHICTPNVSHYEITKYALEKNINVVLEKPLTYSVEEAVELTELAESKKLINAVNFHNRFYPACAYARKYIEKDNLGNIILINGVYLQDWLLHETDYSWRLVGDESGITRSVADIGTHWMDLVEYLTGLRIVEVFADFKTVYQQRKKPLGPVQSFAQISANNYQNIDIDTEDIASVLYRFDNGAVGSLTVSQMVAGIKNRIDVLVSGTKASLEWKLDDLSNLKIGYRDKPMEIITKDYLLMSEVKDLIDFPSGHMEGYPDAIKQVFKQVYSDSEEKFYATFRDGLRQMVLNQAIYDSAKKNEWVKVK